MCICVGVIHLQFLFTQIVYVKAFEGVLGPDLSLLYVVFPLSLRFGCLFYCIGGFEGYSYICVFNNFVIIHVSGPLYVKVAHFVFCILCGFFWGGVKFCFEYIIC
jgi:hypothetical protein